MKVTDESTLIMNNEGAGTTSPAATPSTGKNNPHIWQSVLVGGIPGILLGSAGTLFAATPVADADNDTADSVSEQDGQAEEIAALKAEVAELKESIEGLQEQINASAGPSIGSVPVAYGVDDSMSFSEAFAAARAEVGPGGVFTWHGNVYGTYYESEWNNMSEAEKNEYADAVRHTDYDAPAHAGSGTVHPQEVSHEDGEIHVLGSETVEAEDGQVIHVTSIEVNGHYGEIYDYDNDGKPDAALIDTDDDGRADIALVDENGDGIIDQNEVYLVTPDGLLAMNDPHPEDVLYEGMPDYTNDADVSSMV